MGLVALHLVDLRRRNLRRSTIDQRRYVLARLRRYLDGPLVDASTDELAEYLDRLEHPPSRATELSHVRQFYKWAYRKGAIDRDPAYDLIRPKVRRGQARPIPDEHLAVALAHARERVRPWLFLAAYAGLRAGEISGLRADHLHWEFTPPILFVEDGKGGDDGSVPMCTILVEALEKACLPRVGWCFPRHDGEAGPTPPYLVSAHANRELRDLGIPHTLHTLRHWFGTKTHEANGGNLRETQELLRHRSPVSTAIYTWVAPGAKAETVEALPHLDVVDRGPGLRSRAMKGPATLFAAIAAALAIGWAAPAAAGGEASAPKRACQVAWEGWNRNDSSIGGPTPRTLRRVVRAFDQDGVPKRLQHAADRIIDSDEAWHDLGTLVVACARLGFLPDGRADIVEQVRGLDPRA